jgi:hypothetical protein
LSFHVTSCDIDVTLDQKNYVRGGKSDNLPRGLTHVVNLTINNMVEDYFAIDMIIEYERKKNLIFLDHCSLLAKRSNDPCFLGIF